MANIENLQKEDAVNKLKDLIGASEICIFASNLSGRPISARPMSTQQVDDDGNLWFLSNEASDKNQEIDQDAEVQLFYSNEKSAAFLSVFGNAIISKDKEKAKELWNPLAKNWFEKGVDDPQLTIIKVVPVEAYYWDTKSNKMVSFFKMLAGAISGNTQHEQVQGTIKP